MGDDFCKDKAVALISASTAAKPPVYVGLASGRASDIRAIGAEVVDDPVDFIGHAHIVSPVPHLAQVQGAVIAAEDLERQDRYYDALLEHFVYYPDPSPVVAGWAGPPLRRHA